MSFAPARTKKKCIYCEISVQTA